MKKKNVLVAGANGSTGRIIIDLLKESEKYQPIAMVRKQEQKEHFEKENVATVLGDLEEDLNEAVKGADKIIFAAGSVRMGCAVSAQPYQPSIGSTSVHLWRLALSRVSWYVHEPAALARVCYGVYSSPRDAPVGGWQQ